MNTAHTPGPWMNDHRRGRAIVVDADGNEVCEAYAGAALIAAAPDLLLHLQRLVRAIDRAPANFADGLADEARAAIARATGPDA